ncbi:MAG: hypothetical protein JWR26_1153 [Pedosphaera sp.]|nr:hypothetical protein [Pedosphaera sp.]
MSNPILPVIIVGPAIVTWNGYSYYFKAGLKSEFKRETFKITTDFDGEIDERMKSQRTEISGQPVGMLSTAGIAAMFPYGVSAVGKSIFGATDLPLVIVTKFGGTGNAGQTITYPRGALSKFPQLRLKPTDTLFGDLTFTCLGDPAVQPNTAGAWNTIASATFADTNFDETQIITDTYSAAYGASPYNAIGSMAGFEIDIAMQTAPIPADDYGVVDMILKSLTATAKFAPSNLTEAQVYTLLNGQGSGYVFPGQSLSKANTDLVIAGSGNAARTLTATIKNAGPKQAGFMYSTDKHRHEAVEFTSKRTWTSGGTNALWTLSVA